MGALAVLFAMLLAGALAQSAAAAETAPKITKQTTPSGITIVEEGQSASWEATATGTPTPTQQWEVSTNGTTYTPILGATGTSYTIPSATTGESGHKFRATFTNKVKSVSSAAVTLTVRKKPAVTQQPLPTIVEEGQSAFFEAAASGFPAPSVQWEYSTDSGLTWVNAPSGTSNKLTVANTKTTFSGREYRATFSNTAGEVVTMEVMLTVRKAPAVTKSPTSVTLEEGQSASFEASASGSPPPSVKWELSTNGGANWAPIGGATSPQYTIPSVTTGENGYQYRAAFKNEAGSVTSGAATLTVHTLPVVTSPPAPQTVEEGQPATFEAQASGFPTPTVQWEVSVNNGNTWTAVSGATSTTFTIASAKTTENAHQFRATFTNSAGKASSSSALLTVRKFPAVTKQPTSTTIIEGQSGSFEATASGFPTPTVQWEVSSDNGASWSAITGATSSKLTLTAVTFAQNGYRYRATFTNTAGAVTSASATLTVTVPPVIAVQPQSTTVEQGQTGVLEAQATGEPTPTVQWERSTDAGKTWSAISGATSEQLTLPTVKVSESGYEFRAVFSNSAGKATSAAATLTVATSHYTTVGWGQNRFRELGDGTANSLTDTPVTAIGLHFVTAVASGGTHSLALVANGSVYSWGNNESGQLGNGTNILGETPAKVPGLAAVKAIAAGKSHSLALLTNGTVMAWGNDEYGQLGNGTTKEDSEVPVAVKGLTNVRAIAAGSNFSLALLTNGTVMAWGQDNEGQLGNGTIKGAEEGPGSNVPVPVKGLTGVTSIAGGGEFALAVSKGAVYGWGTDNNGVLDNEEVEEHSDVPVPVGTLTGVNAVAAGYDHALALMADTSVKAWGQDAHGELGIGVIQPHLETPTTIPGLTGVSAISAGPQDSAALLMSGTVMSWGINAAGQLGDGSLASPSDVPVEVVGLSKMAGVSVGGLHMLAYGEPLAAVSGVSPSIGGVGGGTKVTITGVNFTGASAVHFGASAATEFKVESSTSITAVSPPGTGIVDVTVTIEAGTSPKTTADQFTYQPPPTVTKLSAKSGPVTGATPVTITGTQFTAVTGVYFGTTAAAFTVVSPTSITAMAPASAAGLVNVTVSNTAGPSAITSKDQYKYLPTIASLAPGNGPAAGGTSVTVTGSGFSTLPEATSFRFGIVKSKSVSCESSTTCTVLAPAGALGSVDVTATVNKTTSATSPTDRFTYE